MRQAVIVVRDDRGRPEVLQGSAAVGRIEEVRMFLDDTRADYAADGYPEPYAGAAIVRLPRRFAYCHIRHRVVERARALNFQPSWGNVEGRGNW
jgi:hypothetical protein